MNNEQRHNKIHIASLCFFYVITVHNPNEMWFLSQYVTKTVEVESPATLKHLTKARQRNELLSEKLSNQNERCKQLEEQIRKSDEYSCNLQHKVTNMRPKNSGFTSLNSYRSYLL